MKLRLAFLSPAEYEVLKLADEHYSYREIAEIIGVTRQLSRRKWQA